MASIQMQQLRKVYAGGNVEAVKGIDLDIADGEFVVLVGPVGLRQVHPSAHGRRAGNDHSGARCPSASAW
jgi:hypothetical protein